MDACHATKGGFADDVYTAHSAGQEPASVPLKFQWPIKLYPGFLATHGHIMGEKPPLLRTYAT